MPTSEPSWVDRVVANAGAGKCRGVVFVDSSLQPLESVCDPVAAPLRLVQALPPDSAGLFLITRGAQGVDDEDVTTAPWASASWGFGRVVAAERPELRCRLIDISGEADGEFDALVRELGQDSADEVKLRGSSRYVRRLERADPLSPTRNVLVRTTVTPVGLHSTGSGADGLRFTSIPRREPGPGEVEIEVAYVGVNFKDVLKVSGLLTPEALRNSLSGNFLGLECSGTVVRTGEGVTGLAAGDEVFAHGADMFRSHVTVDARRVVPKPGTLSLAQAASLLPVVTAHHALVRLANVRPGERVLIHSAAGGVGLAAVRIARSLGAQVYATAGSEQRREYLQKEGVQTISDSRSTAFFDDVLAWTEGEGVDVVVNSLSGELLEKSVALLRPFGRFVEIGKADIAADRSLGLAAFGKALSFHAFDYDQMLLMRPEVARGCMLDVSELCVRRSVEPLPVSEVSAGAVREAIKGMTAAGHVGKIVVRMGGEELTVPADSMTDPVVRPQATYLITGGLGGLGLEVARWLALNGATHLVLVGRSGVSTDDARRTVTELTNRGVEVRVEEVDIADRGQVGSLIARTRAESPPLRGIIHGAANFDDVVLPDTTAERLVTATRPKADGAWHLHLATREDALDFFVLFSSLAAQIGAPAAGNYVTANEFLNGLARYRRGLGLPATSVGWGMIDQVGVAVQKDGAVGNALRRNGHIGMTPTQLVSELEVLLRARPTEVSVAAIDWRRWAKANPQIAAAPRFSQLVPDADAVHDDMSLPQRLRDSTRADRLTLLPAQVAPVLHAATGVPLDRLGDEQAVDIDSLVAVELRVRLQDTLGVSVPAVKLQRNLTVGRIVTLLADELERQPIGGARESRISTHEFVSSDGTVVYGHLSLPSGPGPHPAVVVCTSGTGGALDDDGQLTRLSEHAPLTEAGFAVFTVDHRGAPGHGPEFSGMAELGGREVDDVIAAAEYLVADPAVDEKRISILGTSRGGYVALLATTRAPMLWHRCVLLMAFAEPGDLLSRAAFTKRNPVPLPPGTTPIEVEAYFAERSRRPLLDLGVAKSPILLVHGDADEVVPHEEAHRIAERAREAGLDGRLISVAGMGHDHDHAGDEWTELWPEIRRFLRGNPHPAAEAEVP
ncbi:SDR family NAD(P)-dependent oxidoreductase [Amycolatopsis sp. EV170708-02-1]|uniref:SDR family NAD(P)-dependent oxidoreductase n=1 Tax=Amycolatopsis sp. EV170708-02-1 TaxID=2919322 RepID=UPI001F0B7E4F|nr:SDR family NAD(P)-dependent oxidoreductase [Amycolatopsis sp. EV170708-02-1]UMP06979.1 SDR family NAD(P)-dependent oxidoreductase [Amycolatopsis sp. EV170708-02-1]